MVNIANMVVLDNPAPFKNPFQFEITFECLQELQEDLEWKVVYVGSAENSDHDQMLDEILVGPVPVGVNKFILQAEAPNVTGIPAKDLLGVTVVLVTCSYKEKEFVRVGYYVNNEYIDPTYDPENGPPPSPLDMTKVVRTILADKPRVTRFPISWTGEEEPTPPPQPDTIDDDENDVLPDDMDDDDDEEMDDDMDDENESDKLLTTMDMEDNNNNNKAISQGNIIVSNE